MKKALKILIYSAGLACVFFVLFLGVNQFDEPLRPEVEKILGAKTEVAPEQVKFFQELRESKVCRTTEMTPPLRLAMQKIIDYGQFVIPKADMGTYNCMSRFVGITGDAFLASILEDFKFQPERARDDLEKLAHTMSNMIVGDNVLIARLIGMAALHKVLQAAVIKSEEFPKLSFKALVSPDLAAFLAMPPATLLEHARDSEIRQTDFLIRSAYREGAPLDLYSLSEDERNRPKPIFSKLLWMTYQPHRTINGLYDHWQLALAEEQACRIAGNCPNEMKSARMSVRDYFINPMGNSILKVMWPNLPAASRKISQRQAEMKTLVNDLKR